MSYLLLQLTFLTIPAAYLTLVGPSKFHLKLLFWTLLAWMTLSPNG